MTQEIFQVDAFANRPFTGNPAAVCILPEARSETWMQQLALEMNLSETAFLRPRDDGWDLRWFTPTIEVDLCGHATLASSHVLWETGRLGPNEKALFHTRSGLLTAQRADGGIEIDLPADPASPAEAPPGLAEALGTSPAFVNRSHADYLVELDSEREVRGLEPDLQWIRTIPVEGFIVTSRATTAGLDFVSRYFAPACGIDEDPVTGAAHCVLGPYWSKKLGLSGLTGFQASRRGGQVGVQVAGERVVLLGKAVTVLRGELLAGA